MESRTGTQLIAEVRYGSDNDGLTARHPDADVLRQINVSIRALRGLVTANGFPYFLTSTSATTLVGTQVAGEDFSSIPWPSAAEQVTGVDVAGSDTTGGWYPLRPVTWAQRRDMGAYGTVPVAAGAPSEFAVMALPQGSGASTTAGSIALFPAANTGFYKVWYLPTFTDLTASDVFLGLPDWITWVVCDAQQVLIGRDDDQHETYTIVSQRKAEAEARLLQGVARVVSAGPLRPRRQSRYWGRRRRV